jgi:preprotein translocase subunit SecG
MQTVLLVIQIMISLALIGLVLIQRSEGGGLGIGGGSGFMSARGTANALTRTTAILAALFFVLTLGQGVLARYQAQPTDILDKIPLTQSGSQNGILDSLGGAKPTTTKPAVPDNGVPSGAGDQAPATAPATPTPATTTAPAATTSAPVTGSDAQKVPTGQ